MKKRIALCLAALAFCLGACQAQPVEPSATPTPPETATPVAEVTPTPVPTPTPEPTPAIDLSALEPWQEAFIQFLQPESRKSREIAREAESGFHALEEYYSLCDVSGDDIPELLIFHWEYGAYYASLYAYSSSTHEPYFLDTFCTGRERYTFICPGGSAFLTCLVLSGPDGTSYGWRKFTLVDNAFFEEDIWEEDIPWEDNGFGSGPAGSPKEATDLVPNAQPLDLIAITGSEGTLNLQPILEYMPDLSPWQEAYLDILLCPEEYEEFYAVAEHVPSDQPELVTSYQEEYVPRTYSFAICDVNADGVAELLLQGASPRVLLNILHYNAETGMVEDLDGPRTYPLMDTLWFYDTGYFSTMNGAGGLYTEFWHLEDKDPDHYWYGFERSATFNADGELVSWEEFPFESSAGEKFTLQEYYELLGEKGVRVLWQELTEETVRQAFLSPAREEATP